MPARRPDLRKNCHFHCPDCGEHFVRRLEWLHDSRTTCPGCDAPLICSWDSDGADCFVIPTVDAL